MLCSSPLLSEKGTIRSVIPMTEDNWLFEFTTESANLSGCMPGQFVELWVPGVGECPISVCSGRVGDSIQLMVRKVGRVTDALFKMREGDWVGLRGPYGHGFPIDSYVGSDLCMIAGGLGVAPIRSLWQYVLDHREDYGKLTLIYGMRHSDELLFKKEFELLMRRRDIDVYIAAEEIIGPELPPVAVQLGRVTDMLRSAALSDSYQAAICGPPVMYKFVINELRQKCVRDESIWLSLERQMKCGIGKCGHCFIGGRSTCQSGPVFPLTELQLMEEVVELDSGAATHVK
ncbi:MAG: FAD/NAD(P)-binding protein [Candidatus Obscuribacterales bacterium]